ncbi:MAG: pitrilysin family protein [Pseudomonadota bacterium]
MSVTAPVEASVEPQSFTLENGMEVVVIPDRRVPVVTHMVWYRVGAADEPPGKGGIAHFLEHLMFKGTDTIEDGQFSRIIARNGGQDNAFTSWDYTAYFQRVARDRLETVMEMEADRMRNLRLSEEAVTTERDVILEERSSRVDNQPSSILRERMSAATFINHPYGQPIIGWEHEIEGLGREDAFSFYDRFYAPKNAILIVAGDVSAEELRPLAEKYYGVIEAGEKVERIRPQDPPSILPKRLTYADARVRQESLSRWYVTPSRNTAEPGEAEALEVLADLLGGGPTSLLYKELVVEQKVAASVGISYGRDAVDNTCLFLSAIPRPGVSLGDLEAALDATLAQFLESGAEEAAVTRSKTNIVDTFIYAQDSQQALAYTVGVGLTTGLDLEATMAWTDAVEDVTLEAVNGAAQRYLVAQGSVTGHLVMAPESPS